MDELFKVETISKTVRRKVNFEEFMEIIEKNKPLGFYCTPWSDTKPFILFEKEPDVSKDWVNIKVMSFLTPSFHSYGWLPLYYYMDRIGGIENYKLIKPIK